ncbi:hypothetical protein H6P81_017329 [Aristolochia fimbriata]|uniref:Uncharacterized protein n=1 Tax=Aristolochia fimbriata TaxID=158543 RepID=A0AAV7DZU2_ARIFI|nr:hypothetical protein H6P81_017329 [Aristolochia fimbriata]
MAESGKGAGEEQRRPSGRLQRRAPASIQVRPASSFASEWKVAIPLLSPLATSPPSLFADPKAAAAAEEEAAARGCDRRSSSSSEGEKVVSRSWQHPAAPFCYEPPARVQMIFPQCT